MSSDDPGATHYYGDGCDDPHGTAVTIDDDGYCERCSERADACECPATTIAVRESLRTASHVTLHVYAGSDTGSRGFAGTLTLRAVEWDELLAVPRTRHGWMLLPLEVLE